MDDCASRCMMKGIEDTLCRLPADIRKKTTIGVQLPDGLKRYASWIAEHIETHWGCDVIISGDNCYGVCDVSEDLVRLGADFILHFGHARLRMITECPRKSSENKKGNTLRWKTRKGSVFFIEMRIPTSALPKDELAKLLEDAERAVASESTKIEKSGANNRTKNTRTKTSVILFTTVQYLDFLPIVKDYLQKRGYSVKIGKPKRRAAYRGQVLGCDLSAVASSVGNTGVPVYIGTGEFHPRGAALATNKRIVIIDIEQRKVRTIYPELDLFLKRRWGLIETALKSKRYGIIVSSKTGQSRIDLAKHLHKLALKAGKKSDIIILGRITPDALMDLGYDAYVSTACPRIALDDYGNYSRPLLTPQEFEIILGTRKWVDYAIDIF